jgi:hypothetical protein
MRTLLSTVAGVSMIFWACPALAQSGTGLEFVLKMEIRAIDGAQGAGAAESFAVEQIRRRVLPDGPAEALYVTDGRSVRKTLRGPMLGQASGTVTLIPTGSGQRFVLDDSNRTYYVVPVEDQSASSPPTPDVVVSRTETFETIQGHKARKVVINQRDAFPAPKGPVPPGTPTEMHTEFELWCAVDVRVPDTLTANLNPLARSTAAPSVIRAAATACPLPLRSRKRYSLMPGYEIVSTITSIRPASPSASLFRVPPDYRQVPPPGAVK